MITFFHSWRRQAGCMLLVMATAVVGMRIRSNIVYDQCVWASSNHKNVVYSLNGEIGWWYWDDNRHQQLSIGSVPLGSEYEAKWRMLLDLNRSLHRARGWSSSHCFVATPFTLLSAILLLWQAKKPKPPQPN